MDIYGTFEKSMVKVFKDVCSELSIVCIPAVSHQNGPEPRVDYCAINTLSIVGVGMADTQRNVLLFNDGTIEYNVQQYEVLVQLQFIGAKAANNATNYFSQVNGNTVVREIYTKNNLAIRRKSNLRRTPQLRENVWVNSFTFDLTLGFAVRTAQDVDWADAITLNGELIPLP